MKTEEYLVIFLLYHKSFIHSARRNWNYEKYYWNDIMCTHENILLYILQKQTFHLPIGNCILSLAVDTSLNLTHSKSLLFRGPNQQVILSRDGSFFPQNPAWGVFPFLKKKKCVIHVHVVLMDMQYISVDYLIKLPDIFL